MKPRLHLTPAKLILVSLSGFLISAGGLPLIRFVHTTDSCDCIRWIPVLLVLGLFLVGGFVAIKATTYLKNGIRNQQWPEEQIEPLRVRLESPLFNALLVLLLFTYGVLWFIFSKYRMIGLAGFLLMQILSQLRTAVRRPPARPSNLLTGWRDLSPIHSDRWGHR